MPRPNQSKGSGKVFSPKKSKGRQASHPTVRLVSTGACLVAVTVRTNTCSQRKTRSPTILCSNEQKYDVLSSPSLRLCFTDAALRNPDKLYPLFLLLLLLLSIFLIAADSSTPPVNVLYIEQRGILPLLLRIIS